MSMNLHCNKLDLWQTPTHITYMCMMTHEGVYSELNGNDAIRALRIYMQWVSSFIPMICTQDDKKRIEELQQRVDSHLEEVQNVLNDPDLTVYYL